jgi:hypothetical protein
LSAKMHLSAAAIAIRKSRSDSFSRLKGSEMPEPSIGRRPADSPEGRARGLERVVTTID